MLTCEGLIGCGETEPWEVVIMGETLFWGSPGSEMTLDQEMCVCWNPLVGQGEGNDFCVEVGGTQVTDSANDMMVMCVWRGW